MKLFIDTHLGRAIKYRSWLAKRVCRYGGIHGMTVGQLAGRAKAPVKFIDPNDATRRWSGAGVRQLGTKPMSLCMGMRDCGFNFEIAILEHLEQRRSVCRKRGVRY